MIDQQLKSHIAKFEINGKELSKLERKIIFTYFSESERTVASIIKSFSKKLGKGDLRVKELLRGLYQDSPVNRAVFSCIERYTSVAGLQKYQANDAMEDTFGTITCTRTGSQVPNITPNDRREFYRRLDRLAETRGQKGLLVPNGASYNNLQLCADFTFNSVKAEQIFAASQSKQLEQELGLNLTAAQKRLLVMTIAHLNPNLATFAKHSADALRKEYDKAIEVVAWRAENTMSSSSPCSTATKD